MRSALIHSLEAFADLICRAWRDLVNVVRRRRPAIGGVVPTSSRMSNDAETRYRSLFDRVPVGLYRSSPSGRILDANPALANILGYADRESLMAKNAADLFTDPRVRPQWVRSLEREDVVRDFEIQLRRLDGTTVWVRDSAYAVRDAGGRVLYYDGVLEDITKHKEAEAALRESEERYRELFEHNLAGVYRTTVDGAVLECNDAFARILGYASREDAMQAKAWDFYAGPDDRRRFLARLEESGSLTNYEQKLQRKDGTTIWTLVSAIFRPEPRWTDSPIIEGTLIDITHRKRTESRLREMAFTDPLTGLANRRLLRRQAQQALAAARRRDSGVALLYLDLAEFKAVNDRLGHEIGDQVLREIARGLHTCARESDTVARVGGDEFAVLLTDVQDGAAAAERAAERLLRCFEQPIVVGAQKVWVGARVGVSLYPDDADDFGTLLKHADRAMYAAQMKERELHIFGPELDARSAPYDADIEHEAHRALDTESLRLFYQPICEARSGTVVGVEALVRWPHPRHGLLVASQFLPLLERARRMGELDRWALAEACFQAKEWSDTAGWSGWVAVNLSTASLNNPEFLNFLRSVLNTSGLSPEHLLIEITERAALANLQEIARNLSEVKDLGVRVALDDFGTGYSSLSLLRHLPADLIKIDRSFVEAIGSDSEDERLIRGVLGLGKSLQIDVAAEGVENDMQLEFLLHERCDLLQGFGLGMPVTADAWLTGKRQIKRPA